MEGPRWKGLGVEESRWKGLSAGKPSLEGLNERARLEGFC